MRPALDEYAQQMTAFFSELFVAGVEKGELEPHDVEARALALFAYVNGITPYLVVSKRLTAELAAGQLCGLFIDDIRDKLRNLP